MYCKNHTLFYSLMLLLFQIILDVLERIFQKELKKLIMTTDDKIRDEKYRSGKNMSIIIWKSL